MTYEEQRQALIRYLEHKVEIQDWHGVSDAANDLREIEAQERGRRKANEIHVEERQPYFRWDMA